MVFAVFQDGRTVPQKWSERKCLEHICFYCSQLCPLLSASTYYLHLAHVTCMSDQHTGIGASPCTALPNDCADTLGGSVANNRLTD